MKIAFINNFSLTHKNIITFAKKKKEIIEKEQSIIRNALLQIKNNPDLPVSYATISSITGYPYPDINNRLHSVSGKENLELWTSLVTLRIKDDSKYVNQTATREKKTQKEIDEDFKKIEWAINQIRENGYEATYKEIANLTGMFYPVVSYRLNRNNRSEYAQSVVKLWLETVEQQNNGAEVSHSVSKDNNNPDDYRRMQAEAIKDAIQRIKNNPLIPARLEQISRITGLSVKTIVNIMYAESSKDLLDEWHEIQGDKRGAATIRTGSNPKAAKLNAGDKIPLYKVRQMEKAISMIKNAIIREEKLSYRELQQISGLNKDEIDDLIKKYAQYKKNKTQNEKKLKEQQAKWYEEKYNKE